MPKIDLQLTGRWLIAGWLAAFALFRGAPSVDLALVHLFWREGAGFYMLDNALWEWLRQRIWDVSILLFLFSAYATVRGVLTGRRVAGLATVVWGYLFALFIAAPGVVVNGWLKMHSGRARPANVSEFGGAHEFTPVGQFADQCSKNCSFVSGEVSAVVVLAVALWLFAAGLRRLEGWQRVYLRVAGVGLVLFVMAQRIVTGRHFPSDTVFALLITLSLGWGLYAVFSGRASDWARRK